MDITLQDLKICGALMKEARNNYDRVMHLREMMERTSRPLRHTPGARSVHKDYMAEGVAAIDEIERNNSERLAMAMQHVIAVESAITTIPDATQREIIRMRYIDAMTWEEISGKTHYHERWCKELHSRGLRRLGIE